MESSPDNAEVEVMLDSEQSGMIEERPVPCNFITGCAGTGKTYQMKNLVKEDERNGILSSTTGISAVNLGAITVHSLLRYSTTEVLRDSWLSGKLTRIMHAIGRKHKRLIIDEISMADADQLDIWHRAAKEVNRYRDMEEPLGITLVGDLLQLPPVKARWCFEANCWEDFERNTTKLTKVWRQDDEGFLSALNLVRAGRGQEGANAISSLGEFSGWQSQLHTEFDGTTILPKNDQVSRFNQMALDRVKGSEFTVSARRWGAQQSEWGQNKRSLEWGIPPQMRLKEGAYVMILANAADFSWANGDCGWIRGYDEDEISIELVRTGEQIQLPRITRGVEYSEKPDGYSGINVYNRDDDTGEYRSQQHYRGRVKRYVMGQIEYFPLRLAYASTVHKSQSLTLDRVQVDYRDHFFKSPGMLYVALSRARTLKGLRLVGQGETFAQRATVDPRVARWI